MAVDPDSLSDPKLVRGLLENAKRAGRQDLVLRCQRRLTRTRQTVDRVGIKKCLEDWAFHKGTTQGFDILVEGGHPELTGEAIVVRHASEFSEQAVESARKRLTGHGIDPAKV